VGDEVGELRAIARQAQATISLFRPEAALEILLPAVERGARVGDDSTSLLLEAQVARGYAFNEELTDAVEWSDRTLTRAERLGDLPVIADVLVTKGMALAQRGRVREGAGLIDVGLAIAEANNIPQTALRARVNLTSMLPLVEPRVGLERAREAFDVARRAGSRDVMAIVAGNTAEFSLFVGPPDWSEAAVEDLVARDVHLDPATRMTLLANVISSRSLRGRPFQDELDEIRTLTHAHATGGALSTFVWESLALWLDFVAGRNAAAVARSRDVALLSSLNAPLTLMLGARSAALARDAAATRELLGLLAETGVRGLVIDAQRDAPAAALEALEGRWPEARLGFDRAIRRLEELGVQLEVGLAWLTIVAVAPHSDPIATRAEQEARAIFERVVAPTFVAQLDQLVAERRGAAPVDRAAAASERAPV
jgi:hypothetical protein